MHVAVVAFSGRTSPSGVCRHAANLALGLLDHPSIEQVTILAGDWQTDYLRRAFGLEGKRLQIVSPQLRNTTLSRNLWYLEGLPKMIRQLRADVVHLTFPMPVLRWTFDVPVLVSLHDLYQFDIPENFGRRRAWLNQSAMRLCLRNVDTVSSVSAATHRRLCELFPKLPKDKTTVVRNAVAQLSRGGHESLPDESVTGPFLLCVAQHRANKNIGLLIDAFHRLRQKGDVSGATKLVIAGHFGPETDQLQQMVREYGLESHVLFLQNVSDASLCALYCDCEVVVAPSFVEGFGLPVAEALSLGCRVVCSDIPAFRELGGDTCTYFDLCSDGGETLAEAIARACRRDKPAVQAFLTPAQVAEEYWELYSDLLQKRNKQMYRKPVAIQMEGDL